VIDHDWEMKRQDRLDAEMLARQDAIHKARLREHLLFVATYFFVGFFWLLAQ
jgi:hypothetical protein